MSTLLILKAVEFAADKHKHQRRKGPDASPYINHPVQVARTIADIGAVGDAEILAAALLHDTLEDTDTTPEELEQSFGARICGFVREVTDDKSLSKAIRKRLQIEHASRLSPGGALIKIGDKISNVSDVAFSPPADWSRQRRVEYLDWAEAVIANCPKVNRALECHFDKVLRQARRGLGEN